MSNSSAPWMIPSQQAGAGKADNYLNINEASQACGLSPSVLRIWELRYGWPNPRRKANGYRSYSPHLVEDLKRIAQLIDEGTPIRQLIVDGLPQWPRGEDVPPPLPRTLDNTRALPFNAGRSEQGIRDDLIRSIETHRSGAALETLQRAAWQLRQKDELDTALAPCVVGISELDHIDRPFPNANDKATILNAITGRCRQLQRGSMDSNGSTIRVHPLHSDDKALAWVTCVALARRNLRAVLNDESPMGHDEKLLIASNGILAGAIVGKAVAVVGGIDADDRIGLRHILKVSNQLNFLS